MYSIFVTTNFRAGHQLCLAGKPEPCHVHDWGVRAAMSGDRLDDSGMLMDFGLIKKKLDEAVADFNEKKLEDCPAFKGINASAENIAKYIYDRIISDLPAQIRLLYVEITETPGCIARYSRQNAV